MDRDVSNRFGIKDIAAKAGVSIGTVDRVLHMRGDVSEATKKRVLEIVRESGYTPNVIARRLSSRKTLQIGIVIPESGDLNPYWEIPFMGIRKAADELARYNTRIICECFDASEESSFRDAFKKVRSQDPDGMILNPAFAGSSIISRSADWMSDRSLSRSTCLREASRRRAFHRWCISTPE